MNTTISNNGTYTITFCPGSHKERKETVQFSVTDRSPNPEIPELIEIELHGGLPAPHNILYVTKESPEITWN